MFTQQGWEILRCWSICLSICLCVHLSDFCDFWLNILNFAGYFCMLNQLIMSTKVDSQHFINSMVINKLFITSFQREKAHIVLNIKSLQTLFPLALWFNNKSTIRFEIKLGHLLWTTRSDFSVIEAIY